jgi:hypothetical protein
VLLTGARRAWTVSIYADGAWFTDQLALARRMLPHIYDEVSI